MKQISIDIVQAKPDIQVEMSTDKPAIQVGIEQPAQIVNGDYNRLSNKPSINNVVLQGNKTGDELGLVNKDVFEAKTNKLQENINKETSRAQSAEQALSQSIQEEHTERAEEDAKLNAQITAETNRATAKENSLEESINSETARATTKENSLQQSINGEIARAKEKENALEASINAEITRATNKESELQTNIDNEAQARQSVDELLDKSIKTVAQGLLDETAERQQQDEAIQASLNAHINNTSNPHKVTKQQVGLGSVDNTSDADKPVSTAQAAAIQRVQDDVDNVQKLIPTQASAENQLADKDFVNSSIQNMAAFYITKDANGNPFNTHAELIAGPYYFQGKVQAPSINDYAIVLRDETKTPDALGQYPTTRYMYDGTQWAFQYIVNNTPLTAAQVAAINSGATKELIDSIPNKYVKPTGGIPESDLSSDVQTSLGLAKTAVQSFEAKATIDDTTGTPTVNVEKSGEPTSPTYTFIFKHLKGMPGKDGKDGGQGPQGPQGVGVKSITSGTPTVVNDKTNTPITITLTDNTTVDLVVSAENGKDGTSATVDIVQTTGQSESAVMSQKAVTDELNKKANSADLATVATSGSYNDLLNKPNIPTNYVTTNTEQDITGKKTVVTPPDTDDSTQIANTAWVLRNYNNANICYRGVDSNAKYAGYYKVAEATLPTWYRISSARVFVQDFDSADNGILNVNVYAGSTTVDGVATASTTAQVGFLEGTNCLGIKGHFFIVVRKQSTTEKKPIKVELWYRQTGAYQRISATFINDIGDSRGGLTASNKWVKFTRTGAQEQSYFDKNVVDLTNGFVPNGKFTTTDIALDGYPVTEIYDDSTNNAQFIAGSIRVANSQTARSDTPTTVSKREIIFTDKNNASIANIQSSVGSNWNGLNLALTNKSGDGNSIEFVHDNPRSVWRFNPASSSLPIELGEPNRPWTNAYVKDNIYISQTSGQNAGITWQSASDKTNRGIFRHNDNGTTETFVAQSDGFLFRPLNNNNTKSIKVDPKTGALYPEQNAGATLGKESQRWNDAYIQNSINLYTGSSGTPNVNVVNTGLTSGTNPTATKYSNLNFGEVNGKNLSVVRSQVTSTGRTSTDLWTRSFGTNHGNYVGFFASPNAKSADTAGVWHFSPNLDAKHDLGKSNLHWNNAYIKNIHADNIPFIPFYSDSLSTGTYRSTKLPSGCSLVYIEDRDKRFSGYFYQGSGQSGFQELYFITSYYTVSSGKTTLVIYELRINGVQVEKTYKNLFVSSNGSVEVSGEYVENGTFYYKVLK